MLTRVTITGADDAVSPRELCALSEEFPFVEWGILVSGTRQGSPRYPCHVWIEQLADFALDEGMDCSVHFCGSFARGLMSYGDFPPSWLWFGRVQVNGWSGNLNEPFLDVIRRRPVGWILQCGDEPGIQDAIELARTFEMGRVSALFDASGGRGIEPFQWPVSPRALHLGFAGGIGPDNLVEVLRDIGPRDAPFCFDLAKVRAVLEAAKPFVSAG